MPKQKIVFITFVLLNFFISLLLWDILKNEASLSMGNGVWVSALVILTLSLWVLASFLFTALQMYRLFGSFTLGFLLILGFTQHFIIGSFIAFALFAWAVYLLRHDIKTRTTTSFYPLVFLGIPTFITIFAMLFALVGYAHFFQFNTLTVNQTILRYAMIPIEPILKIRIPTYHKDMTLDQLLIENNKQIINQVQKNTIILKSTQDNFDIYINKEAKKQRNNLAEQFNIELSGEETLEKFLALSSSAYISRLLGSYQNVAVPSVVAISIFLMIKSIGFLIGRITIIFTWILAKLLIALGIIHKVKVAVEKEKFVLK